MEGIVLSVVPYRENDAIVIILGDDNEKHSYCLKGSLKMNSRNKAFVQKHFHIRFEEVEAKGFPLMRQVELINSFQSIHQQLLYMIAADYMCEWFEKYESSLPFSLLKYYLESLPIDVYRTLCFFQAYVNEMEGITPHVDSCVKCGSTKNIAVISIKNGGFLCRNCQSLSHQVRNKNELYHFRILGKIQIDDYSKVKDIPFFKEDFINMMSFYEEYGSIRWKSYRFFKNYLQD